MVSMLFDFLTTVNVTNGFSSVVLRDLVEIHQHFRGTGCLLLLSRTVCKMTQLKCHFLDHELYYPTLLNILENYRNKLCTRSYIFIFCNFHIGGILVINMNVTVSFDFVFF